MAVKSRLKKAGRKIWRKAISTEKRSVAKPLAKPYQ